jgi:hypothetical protein
MVYLRPLCGLVEDQVERPIQVSDKVAGFGFEKCAAGLLRCACWSPAHEFGRALECLAEHVNCRHPAGGAERSLHGCAPSGTACRGQSVLVASGAPLTLLRLPF